MSNSLRGSGYYSGYEYNYNASGWIECPDCFRNTETHQLWHDDFNQYYIVCDNCDYKIEMEYKDD